MNLPKIQGEYKFNYNIAHLTRFKVGGIVSTLFKPKDLADLAYFLRTKNTALEVVVIGAGSNIIIRDGGIKGVVIKLGNSFSKIEDLTTSTLSVGSSCLNYNLAKFTAARSIRGFEFLIGIPGTIGGGVAMNAGAYGSEFKDVVISVEALDTQGNLKSFSLPEIGFCYRNNSLPKNTIFTKVIFKKEFGNLHQIQDKMKTINHKRLNTQPITKRTGGSTFTNPHGYKAWELIHSTGLRGYVFGGASVSTKHCNFIINDGNANASDIENLGEFIRKQVKQNTGIELQWEIKRIGQNEKIKYI